MIVYSKTVAAGKYIEEYDSLNDSDKRDFSYACNKLISENFIYGQRGYDDDLYRIINRLRTTIEYFFFLVDFELIHDDNYKIFFLRSKIENIRVKLKKLETVILLVLAKLYSTRSIDLGTFNGSEVDVKMSTLIEQIEKTRIFNRMPTKSDIAAALQTLKRYKLVDVITTDIANVDAFKLLPTILYIIKETDLESIEDRIKGLAGEVEDNNGNDVEGEDNDETEQD